MDLDTVDDDTLDQLADRLADRLDPGAYGDRVVLSRRQLVGVATGVLGTGTLLSLGVDPAAAQAAGSVGTSSDPVDVFAYDLDVANGVSMNGNDITNAGSVSTNILESDWVTDAANYSDLQTALNQAGGATGTVVAPPGQYIQSSTLTVPAGVTLIGLTNPKNTPRLQIIGGGGVDPVVTTDSGNSHTISRVRIEPDSTEDAFNGSLRFGELSYCDCLGDIVVSDSDNISGSGVVFGNLLGGNNITADSGVSSTCLIAHNRDVGTITSNSATEGTNS